MNRFAVLDTSDNEEEVPKVSTQKKSKDDSANKAPKKDAPAKQPVKATENKPKDNASTNKDNKNAEKQKPAGSAAPGEGAEVAKDNNRGGRPRGKDGRHGERHHKNGESQENSDKPKRQKREFERRSGTGRGREVSRGGRGPYGAGNVEQEAQDAEKDPKSVEVEGQEAAEQAQVDGEDNSPAAESVPESEPEPATFTLDEYLQKRNSARAASSILTEAKNVRVVDVSTQFAGLTTKGDADDTYIASKVVKSASSKKDQRSTSKSVLEVGITFASPAVAPKRERREYDNKTGKGGKFVKNNTGKKPAPAKFDQGDFPSL